MKARLAMLKLFVILCLTVVTTAAFGQAFYVWTNALGGDLATTNNWNPHGTPSGTTGGIGDTMQFDGTSPAPGPVRATSNTGAQTGFSGSQDGLTLLLTNNVGLVQLHTTVANSASTGLRFNSISIDVGSGPLFLGKNSTTNCLDFVMGGAAGQLHDWVNNSAQPACVCPDTRYRMGGGGDHIFVFDGSGNWNVTNDLVPANGADITVDKVGSGTLYWSPGHNAYNAEIGALQGPYTFAGGTVVLQGAGLFATVGGSSIANNGVLLEWDAGAASDTLNGILSGTGNFQVNSGTITLSGANTYSGNTILSGGTVIVNRAENPGVNGPLGLLNIITNSGGILKYSINNSYDYSFRFDTSPGQQYKIDTAGQNVTFATGLSSSGGTLTKNGAGTLTITAASGYTGATTVNAGEVKFGAATKTGTGPITLADGAALGVTDPAGTEVTASTLTLGSASGATLEFINVTNTTSAPLGCTNLVSSGTTTINITSGSFQSSQSYPLLAWDSGTPPGVTLGVLNGALGNLSTNGNTIQLNITSIAATWTGTNNGNWDITTTNWIQGTTQVLYSDPTPVVFDDSAPGTTSVTVAAPVAPKSVTANNSLLAYTITSSGVNNIGGTASLIKQGTNTLTLSGGTNSYTGITTVSAGILSVSALANGGSASDIGASGNGATNLVLNGGTLQYTGAAATVNRLFTLNAAGGAIDSSGSGALYLNNPGSILVPGSGAHGLILTGTLAGTNTLAAVLSDGNGGGTSSLTKDNTGTWIVTGTNTYSGGTVINAGTLQVGASPNGTLGTGPVIDNGVLDFHRSDTFTNPGAISGSGSVTVDGGGTIVLPGNNSYSGAAGTTISNGCTLQIGTGGATGSLLNVGPIVDNGLFVVNTTTSFSYLGAGLISGTGNVIIRAGGRQKFTGINSYTGWTQIDPGATFEPTEGQDGALYSSVVTNNGTLLFARQDNGVFIYTNNIFGSGKLIKDVSNQNPGDVTLYGTNNATGGTLIGGGTIIVGNGVTNGWLIGNVVFTNSQISPNDNFRSLAFNHSDNVTFPGTISGPGGGTAGNAGQVWQLGTGVLTLTANNTYLAGTVVSNGTLQVGSGGTTGTIGGPGGVNLGNPTTNCAIVFNRSNNVLFSNNISGSGSLVQFGAGILTLSNYMPNIGPTTVSNGTLVVSGAQLLGGSLNVSGGMIVAGGLSQISTLTVSNGMNINSGIVMAAVNKSQAQSNTIYNVNGGTISATGGAITVSNLGPAILAGDRFFVFSQAVSGGGALTVSGGNVTWSNNVANDGSIIALTSGVIIPNVSARITSISLSGANAVLNATNGVNGGTYYLLGSTNMATQLSQWAALATNVVNTNGSATAGFTFTGTNVVTPNSRQQFYILSNTNN